MLSTVAVKALWNEQEDAIEAIEDAPREAKEERLAVVEEENVRGAT